MLRCFIFYENEPSQALRASSPEGRALLLLIGRC